MSITASIVALAVMIVRIPLRKAPKIFSYALWGVVMFRLIFSFSFESVFSMMPAPISIIPRDIVSTNTGVQFVDASLSVTADNTMPVIGHVSESNLIITAIEAAGYVWLFGFIILLAYAVTGYVSLMLRVRFATLIRDNIYETDRIKTPFVFGLIRPKIYFPTTIDPSRHDYILKHEQIHIKRRDYLIKPFAYIVFALHWFNPLMWIAYFLMSKDMEMSCDEAVLRKTNKDIRKDYSMSLLDLSMKRASLLSPIAFASGESSVKERIVNVLRFKRSANWVAVISVIIVGVFLVGFSSDRVLAIDTPSSVSSDAFTDATIFNITNWHTDRRGTRVADSNEAQEIGMIILNKYFSVFRHDWGNWEGMPFSLTASPIGTSVNGDSHIPPWFGRVPESTGSGYFFTHPFIFYIDAEIGGLISASYFPPAEYITTGTAPFTISFEEALDIYGDWWAEPLPLDLDIEYEDILIEFSLALLNETGFSNNTAIFAGIVRTGGNFSNNFVNITVGVVFANGESAMLSFWVFEAQFTLLALELEF